MSCCRLQAQVDVPPEALWELVGNAERHPEWWPRVVDVHSEGLEEGCSYRQVFKSPMGVIETDVSQGGTFIDVEFGLDPKTTSVRVFDAVAGRRWFRQWLHESVEALRAAARERVTV
jgi:hypothetical protein